MTEAVERRGLTKKQAAERCGLSTSGFDDWVRRKLVPGPIPGTHRYDRLALEAALDKLSGIAPTKELSPYDKWKAGRNARAA